MNVVKTDIPDVMIFEPKVFGDERGFSLKALAKKFSRKQLGEKLNLYRITIRNRAKAFCVDCTIS